jgi:hypothetical protein
MGFTRCSNFPRTVRCVTAIADLESSQGSTRADPKTNKISDPLPDTLLVWSLEESNQQKGGIPQEFTFVFLISHGLPVATLDGISAAGFHVSEEAKRVSGGLDGAAADTSQHHNGPGILKYKGNGKKTATTTEAQELDLSATDSLKIKINPVRQEASENETSENPNNFKLLPKDYNSIFGPITLNVCVRPQIAGFKQHIVEGELEHTAIELDHAPNRVGFPILDSELYHLSVTKEIGQKFFNVNEKGVETGGLYNLANLPGGLEDMVELPGNSSTTVACFNHSVDLMGLELTLNRSQCCRLREKPIDLLWCRRITQ